MLDTQEVIQGISAQRKAVPSRLSFSGKTLVPVVSILARAICAVTCLSVLSALYPFQPWQPLWYIKVGQVAVDYSVSWLFVLFLALLAYYYAIRENKAAKRKSFLNAICSLAIITYCLSLPLQMFGFGLHFLQSNDQNKQRLKEAERQVSVVVKGIKSADSQSELMFALGKSGVPQPVDAPPLSDQKRLLTKALQDRLFFVQSRIKDEQQQRLTSLAVSTTRGVLSAGILAVALFAVRKAIRNL